MSGLRDFKPFIWPRSQEAGLPVTETEGLTGTANKIMAWSSFPVPRPLRCGPTLREALGIEDIEADTGDPRTRG